MREGLDLLNSSSSESSGTDNEEDERERRRKRREHAKQAAVAAADEAVLDTEVETSVRDCTRRMQQISTTDPAARTTGMDKNVQIKQSGTACPSGAENAVKNPKKACPSGA
jgi:hypothetical protein